MIVDFQFIIMKTEYLTPTFWDLIIGPKRRKQIQWQKKNKILNWNSN